MWNSIEFGFNSDFFMAASNGIFSSSNIENFFFVLFLLFPLYARFVVFLGNLWEEELMEMIKTLEICGNNNTKLCACRYVCYNTVGSSKLQFPKYFFYWCNCTRVCTNLANDYLFAKIIYLKNYTLFWNF